MNADLRGRNVLLLQGPNGPFFRRLYDELGLAGANITKVNLNAADALYFLGRKATSFRGKQEAWPQFLRELIKEKNIECCFLFGDFRPYHVAARPILKECGVPVWVFEDGYLRPDYVTIEAEGVNNRSRLKHNCPDFEESSDSAPVPQPVKNAFAWSVFHTIINSLAVTLGKIAYPHYRHHRDVNTARQAMLWARSGIRHVHYRRKEAHFLRLIRSDWDKKYFLVGLQVFSDSQVTTSRFSDVRDFIEEVIRSFATRASPSAHLIIKHHPADRAYRDYTRLIARLAQKHRLQDRLHYVHDLHLPTLLRHAKGTIVINSTIGWSSLHHGTPVLALDETIYGFMGLNAPGSLDEFWTNQPQVNRNRVLAAENWLKRHSQANGSTWVRLPDTGPSGLIWPPHLKF